MRRDLPGDRATAGVAGAVSGDSTHLVAGGDAPRPAGAGGRPFAASIHGSHGLGLSGHADRAVGRSRPGRVYLRGTAGPAARGPRPRIHVHWGHTHTARPGFKNGLRSAPPSFLRAMV